jgi:hypothetical protein
MPPRSNPTQGVLLALTAGLSLALGGCSSDDISLNGGIFDAVGLSDSARANATADVKVAERPGLVVPPTLDNLPAPTDAAAPEPNQIAGINDPDAAKKVSQAEKERQQEEFCAKNYTDAQMRGEEAAMVEGPLGPCRKSVLTAIKKWNSGETDDTQ